MRLFENLIVDSTDKLIESILLETHYDKKAADIIVNSGLFDQETSQKIIDGLFRQDIHAFIHSPSWLEKYLKGIARMLVEESNRDKSKAQEFLVECPTIYDRYLEYIKQIRDKLSDKEKLALDDEFVQKMSYSDVKKKVEEIQDQLDNESKDKLSKMKFSANSYQLVPIESYEQMHNLFGGHLTGDGSSDKYAGGGGTAWCHTNSENVYNSWVDSDKYKFFVLAKKNWKDIKFNEYTNSKNAKDEYGNSLIVILVKSNNGRLEKATLRSNHVGNLIGPADNQYQTYAELSEIAGFNVEELVKQELEKEGLIGEDDIFYYDGTNKPPIDVEKIIVKDGVTKIKDEVFFNCSLLQSIIIPDSVTEIGITSFSYCTSLRKITIPSSVNIINILAFYECHSLESITIPSSVAEVKEYAFCNCTSLKEIKISSSVIKIEKDAFEGCASLRSITIPKRFSDKLDYIGIDEGKTKVEFY